MVHNEEQGAEYTISSLLFKVGDARCERRICLDFSLTDAKVLHEPVACTILHHEATFLRDATNNKSMYLKGDFFCITQAHEALGIPCPVILAKAVVILTLQILAITNARFV